MRVLFVPSGDDKYGAPKSMMELVGNLKERHGIEPIVMTCSDGMINKWCAENGIECHILGQGSFMVVGGSNWFRKIVKHSMFPYLRYRYLKANKRAQIKIEELLEGKQIDIVHTNVNRIDIGGYYALAHDIPHVWHLREFGKEDYNCMYLRTDAISFMNKSTNKFVAISEAVKQAWSEKGLDINKIDVIYNGIDLSRFSEKIPERVYKEDKEVKIVFAGIISETKGQIQLIKAVEVLPEKIRQKINIDFYGGGREAYISHLKKYVRSKGLESHICFKGYCSNIPEVLPQYDVGVVASRAEAFGRVTAEYMAAGLCVIASNTGANPEIVEHKKTGLIYRHGDVRELAECIKMLVEQPETFKQMRLTAFEDVRYKYTMDRCSDDIYDLYREILEIKK